MRGDSRDEPDRRTDLVRVVAGVLRGPDGRYLLAQRPRGKAHAGLWEFPGGKVEAGEDDARALARELDEELGIRIGDARFLRRTLWRYPQHDVELISLEVPAWSGTPEARHAEALRWATASELLALPMPEADRPTAVGLALPRVYAITPEPGRDPARFLEGVARTLAGGVRLLQLRCRSLARDELAALARAVLPIAQRYGALAILNGEAALAAELGFAGVQLRSEQLQASPPRPLRRDFVVGASCHDAAELARAAAIGADFAVLAPVLSGGSRPSGAPLGWPRFASLAASTPLPVFALGGVSPGLIERARDAGAHGVAGISAFWNRAADAARD